jgi:LacI family transcriptional regulator
MSLRVRPRVALLVESSRSYGRELLKGIALFARTRTNWSLLHQEMSIDDMPPDWLESSGISGVIARVDQHSVQRLRDLRVPVVDVRCRKKFAEMPRVDTDDRAVAALAFEHLRERGFERFAYCGFQLTHYSTARLKYFREQTDQAGYPLSVYESPSGGQQITGAEQSGLVDDQGVSNWLKTLQPPTGLFVCNDIRGQQVLNVCRTSGIDVPDSVGVVGVDDDDAICPLCDPPLSSVRPDAHGVGYRAAEILHDMMRGAPATSNLDLISPKSVVSRLSSQVHASDDREIALACRFIREQACDGINVEDVANFVSISRRQLERRFRLELNRTPHQEITAVQIARVQQLLLETPMTLEQITPLAGYTHKEQLCAVFKRETGETPGGYRRRVRGHL